MFVYEEPHDNIYAHHDIPLPVFPLCLAWMDYRPHPALLSQSDMASAPRANMLAVGTFAPFIEIWDLDVIDALEPVAVLGAEGAQAALDAQDGAAAEAVLMQNRKSTKEKKDKAKKKKKKGGGSGGVEGHTDAVMALAWSHLRRNVLASGSADHTVRAPHHRIPQRSWRVPEARSLPILGCANSTDPKTSHRVSSFVMPVTGSLVGSSR